MSDQHDPMEAVAKAFDAEQSIIILQAAARKELGSLRAALQACGDPNVRDSDGCSALYTCTGNGFIQVCHWPGQRTG